MSSYQGNKVLMGDMNTQPNSHTIRLIFLSSLHPFSTHSGFLKDHSVLMVCILRTLRMPGIMLKMLTNFLV